MRISERLLAIKPSATLTINAKAQELKAQGRNVTSLAVGQPDFPCPAHVAEAIKKALDEGKTRYTPVPGTPEMREAIAFYYKKFYGVKAEAAETMACNGGKHVLYNLFMALVNPGDHVLVPAPYWVSYPAMVELAGGKCVFVPTEPEKDFLLDVQDLEAARTPETRLLILNTPSNPTGCHYTVERLERLASWARDRGIFVISDEVYDRLVFPPAEPASLSPFWARHPESVAVVGALSKIFCMPGLRLGFVLGHADLVAAMSKIQGQSTSNVNSATQAGGVAALTGPWDEVDAMREAFVRRRDLALSIISSWKGVVCPEPMGAFYLFPSMASAYDERTSDSTALCTRLLDEAGVAMVPGAAFGDDRCVRLSYAVEDSILEKALVAMGRVLGL